MSEQVEFDRRMLEALVCPLTQAPLRYDAERQELEDGREIGERHVLEGKDEGQGTGNLHRDAPADPAPVWTWDSQAEGAVAKGDDTKRHGREGATERNRLERGQVRSDGLHAGVVHREGDHRDHHQERAAQIVGKCHFCLLCANPCRGVLSLAAQVRPIAGELQWQAAINPLPYGLNFPELRRICPKSQSEVESNQHGQSPSVPPAGSRRSGKGRLAFAPGSHADDDHGVHHGGADIGVFRACRPDHSHGSAGGSRYGQLRPKAQSAA